MFRRIVKRALVTDVVAGLIQVREQGGASKVHVGQLITTLIRFAVRFTMAACHEPGLRQGVSCSGAISAKGTATGLRPGTLAC